MTILTIGMAVGALSMQTLDGRPITMTNYAERRGTMVLFLSSRSPAVTAALPAILRVYEKHRREELLYVGLVANPAESAAEIRAFCERNHANFPVYRDPGGAIAKRFGATVTPEGFLIDAQGVYRFHAGFQDDAAVARTEAAMAAAIAGQPVEAGDSAPTGTPIGEAGTKGSEDDPVEPVHFASELVFDKIAWAPDHHCSTLCEAPDGDLLCVWYGGPYEVSDDQVLYIARRRRGGRTWSKPQVLTRGEYLKPPGNAVVFRVSPTRVMVLYDRLEESRPIRAGRWHGSKLMCLTSDDGGRTWTKDAPMPIETGGIRNAPITLSDGRLAVPVSSPKACFLTTRDQGRTWALSGQIDAGGQPTAVQRGDGSLLCYLRSQPWTLQSESRDLGATWTPTKPSPFRCPGAAIALCRLANGHLLLVFDDSATDRYPLSVARSKDDGATWSRPVSLEANPGQYAYPCMIQASDGLIHISYTFNRWTIKHVEFDEGWLERMMGDG